MHTNALEILDTEDALENTRLFAEFVQYIDSPLQCVDVVIDPLVESAGNHALDIDAAQKTNI